MKQKRIISDLSGDTGRVIDAREIGGNGSSVTVDSALSNSSTNPVENKVVNKAVQDLLETVTGKADAPMPTAVSGTTPTIEPQANTIYKCGELTSLTISNPPKGGAYSIVFTSGATATVVTGIDNFTVEANKRYRIDVEDGYATFASWPYTPTP